MAFETLLQKPASELDLLDQIAAEIQKNYLNYQNEYHFLKLSNCENGTSKVEWIRTFSDFEVFWKFVFDTTHERSCILIKFEKDKYETMCFGYYKFAHDFVLPDMQKRIATFEGRQDLESSIMIPWDVIRKGFGEIKESLDSSKWSKTV